MWAAERHRRILEVIASLGRIEAEAAAAQLRVSRETIRRDLKHLEDLGRLSRVHGGAVDAEASSEMPFRARRRAQVEAKRRIARSAASLLRPGMSCFIDAGTTTTAFASALAQIGQIFVITNSIEAATALRAVDAGAEIVLLGGRFGLEVPATQGELTIAGIARFHVDVAVLSPVGVHPQRGVTYDNLAEAEIARTMIQNAATTMLLADRTKLGRICRHVVCSCGDLGSLVTDAPAESNEPFRLAGVARIVTADALDVADPDARGKRASN